MADLSSLTISNSILRIPPVNIKIESELTPIKPVQNEFSDSVVEISQLAVTLQTNEAQQSAVKEIEKIADDVVRVSSTIGKAKSQGNLTAEQAADLYNKIAQLL
mgnify:FL=1